MRSSIVSKSGNNPRNEPERDELLRSRLFIMYIHPNPKAMAKAAYPIKQVITWLVSQLLCSAGMSGWIRLLILGDRDANAMAINTTGTTNVPRLLFFIRHSKTR